MDEQHDAFLCRLSSLPSPPVLHHFSAASVSHRAAGLLSVFSLTHLNLLDLKGTVRRSELTAFVLAFTSAPAPLVSLVLPKMQVEPGDDARAEAAVHDDAAAVCGALRPPLSRFLHCDASAATWRR